jgi:hypothetical protein
MTTPGYLRASLAAAALRSGIHGSVWDIFFGVSERVRRVGPFGSAWHRGGQDDIDVLEHPGTFDPRAAARRKEEPLRALLVV